LLSVTVIVITVTKAGVYVVTFGSLCYDFETMKVLISSLIIATAVATLVRAQEESASPSEKAKAYPEVPKEYEVGEDTISPDERFAILYPVRDEDSNNASSSPPNVLVRLKPYSALEDVSPENGLGWKGSRGEPEARWNGNSMVAVWHAMKWGKEDLVVYEIENDKVKRVQKIWPEVVKIFDRDFHQRFLKKYPKESDNYTFVADDSDAKTFEFKDHKLILNVLAENKPNLAPGPVWSAELHAVWDLDKAKFAKVDFKPGEISVRKPED